MKPGSQFGISRVLRKRHKHLALAVTGLKCLCGKRTRLSENAPKLDRPVNLYRGKVWGQASQTRNAASAAADCGFRLETYDVVLGQYIGTLVLCSRAEILVLGTAIVYSFLTFVKI